MVVSQCLVGNMMGNLVDLERRQRRIWASRTELPSAYFDRFGSLEELLKDAGNVLSIAHNFSVRIEFTELEEFMGLGSSFWLFS